MPVVKPALLAVPASGLRSMVRMGTAYSACSSVRTVWRKDIMNDPVELKGAKILIVGDSTAKQDLSREMLEHAGCQVRLAPSLDNALNIAANFSPDIILLNAKVEGRDGFETCRRLKQAEEFLDIPVIFISATLNSKELVNSFEAGGVDCISPYVTLDEFLSKMRTSLHIQSSLRKRKKDLKALADAQKEYEALIDTKNKFLASIIGNVRDSLLEISKTGKQIQKSVTDGDLERKALDEKLSEINESLESTLGLLEKLLRWPGVKLGQMLDLFQMDVCDQDLLTLVNGLENLRFLSLADTDITNRCLSHLQGMKDLRELHLDNTKVNDDGLPLLTAFENLEILDLKETSVTNEGLARLKPLRNLRGLYLTRTSIGDAGLVHLSNFPKLQILILWQTKITDQGLVHLESLKNLQELILWNTDVTEEGARRLREALPDCDISLDMYA